MRKVELKRRKSKMPKVDISFNFLGFLQNLLKLRKFGFILLVAAVIGIIGIDLNKFAYSNVFDCKLEFEGFNVLPKEDVKNILLQLNDKSSDEFNFFKIGPLQITQLLKEHYNRIKDIKIVRGLDRRMKVIITERRPVAILERTANNNRPFYLHVSYDKKLFEIEKNPSEREVKLPLIKGLEKQPFDSQNFFEKLDIALKIINNSNKQGLNIDKVQINEYSTAIVYLNKGKYKAIIGKENIGQKIEKLQQLIYSDAAGKYNVFDLRSFPKIIGRRS